MFSSRFLILFSFPCFLILSGCSQLQGKFNAQREPTFNRAIERVLVIYQDSDVATEALGRRFSEAFLVRLTERLRQEGVASEVFRSEEEALNANKMLNAAVERFRATQALYVGLKRRDIRFYRHHRDTGRIDTEDWITFFFEMRDRASEDTIWKGDVRYPVIPDPKNVADQLIERMMADRLVGPK